ncbi:DUF3180 domain-containing protein [Mycetocola lacteus]|uniref:DUF3180 domain-containing protein n=1 Tax=Mycetocola lacteus TaxID=76637 RepID=A0A3L7AXG4_9MICO|nr:DUF3180 domain-containing protein [Mycetocola lacteus]
MVGPGPRCDPPRCRTGRRAPACVADHPDRNGTAVKRTSYGVLIGLLAIGAAVGALTNMTLAGLGRPLLTPALSLPITLLLIAGVTVFLAARIYRAIRATPRRRVDSFYAMRILVLAKAEAVTGALLSGVGLGLIGFLLSRAVSPALNSWVPLVIATVGALILCAGGLIAEYLCTLPEDTDDDLPGAAPASS